MPKGCESWRGNEEKRSTCKKAVGHEGRHRDPEGREWDATYVEPPYQLGIYGCDHCGTATVELKGDGVPAKCANAKCPGGYVSLTQIGHYTRSSL